MVNSMRLTVLTDDKVRKRGYIAEHGLSLFIEVDDKIILFDTGQSDVFLKNAIKANTNIDGIDHIILSHGHYDHCKGMAYLPLLHKDPKVYAQHSAFLDKHALNSDQKSYRNVGSLWLNSDERIVYIDPNYQIDEHLYLLADIPVTVDFEPVPRGFYIKREDGSMIIDDLRDEQLLIIDTNEGLIVISGCSHFGIINGLNHVQAQFPNKKIKSVVAGMHLENANDERIDKTIKGLSQFDLKHLIPLHCTGIMAIAKLKDAFKDKCFILYAGDQIEI